MSTRGETMGIDPVCGMTVEPKTSNWVSQYRGNSYHFCSEGCMKAFNADPEHYLARSASRHGDHRQMSMGGCCGGGGMMGRGWLSYVYIGFMLLYLASRFLR